MALAFRRNAQAREKALISGESGSLKSKTQQEEEGTREAANRSAKKRCSIFSPPNRKQKRMKPDKRRLAAEVKQLN